jgi:hypothetical protein
VLSSSFSFLPQTVRPEGNAEHLLEYVQAAIRLDTPLHAEHPVDDSEVSYTPGYLRQEEQKLDSRKGHLGSAIQPG